MSTSLPTPLRALLGLAALAVEEARKFPETLPTAVTTMPVEAVSAAMQASLKFQQQLAMLAAKGDEVISQFRGTSSEAPEWATFDDEPAAGPRTMAAFDRIGFHSDAEDDPFETGHWDTSSDEAETADSLTADEALIVAELSSAELPLKSGDVLTETAELASTAKATATKASTTKASTTKASTTKATATKATATKATARKAPAKSAPAKPKKTASGPAGLGVPVPPAE